MIEEFLERLEAVKPLHGGGHIARCPAHDDGRPSLSVSEGEGKILLNCFAGCTFEEVVDAAGLTPLDLFTDGGDKQSDIAATYPYTDEQGDLLYEVVRFYPKDFRQRRPSAVSGEWEWNLNGVRNVLYRLPEVLKAEQVVVVEGEKDVHALEKRGVVATTASGGAGKWRPEYAEALRGKRVVVIADADEPGRRHAQACADNLKAVAASVKVMEPAVGKDVFDHLAAGKRLSELVPSGGGTQPFQTLSEALRSAPSKPNWLWEGFLAPGAITLLAGKPKVGKSTVVAGLMDAMLKGNEFLGQPVKTTRQILLLSEEREGTLAEKMRAYQLDDPRILLQMRYQAKQSWPELIESVAEVDPELLIIDTWNEWAALADERENSAGAVLDALRPLQTLAGSGTAVLLIAHSRKGGGSYGDAVRGTNALPGAVDLVLTLERGEGDERWLKAVSRYSATPETLKIELAWNGYQLAESAMLY